MALTREFKATLQSRLNTDQAFREALFGEALNACLGGDLETGKALLRDLVKGLIGFEELAAEVHKPAKSLQRMLATKGNPTTENFFAILQVLQRRAGITLRISTGQA